MAFCQKCGKELNASDMFCTNCGEKTGKVDISDIASNVKTSVKTKVSEFKQTNANSQQENQQFYSNDRQAQNANYVQTNIPSAETFYQNQMVSIPSNYKPLGVWAFFGYSILFSIPIIGLIVNLILCFNSNNLSRRNYARSFWCWYLIVAIAAIIIIASGATLLSNF